MQIYLLRHGIAEEPRPGLRDPERPLTDEGRRRARAVLERARAARVAPGLILSSPYVRARQTAELAAEVLGYRGEIVPAKALVPESAPEEAWAELRLYKDADQILCASHEPLCGRLAAFLLGAPALRIEFKKGALLRVDLERLGAAPRGVLAWMLTAKLS